MKNQTQSITFHAGRYIAFLFPEGLPSNLFFHNFHHTYHVVQGVRDISKHLKLKSTEIEILELAAWFHDSGHILTYQGHEAESIKIAEAFLKTFDYPIDKTHQVIACINATRMPQKPESLLQEVICDADLYHLSLAEYPHLQHQLRKEWEQVCDKHYSNEEWIQTNLFFLEEHHYFTSYGRTVLEQRKLLNIERFIQFMNESMAA